MPKLLCPATVPGGLRRVSLPAVLLLLLLVPLTACHDQAATPTEPMPGTANQDDYGVPNNMHIKQVPVDQIGISFGVLADTHIDTDHCGDDGNHMVNARRVVRDLNKECDKQDCLGVVHLGDMTMTQNTQQVVAFRQLYEDSYPGPDGGAIAHCSDDDYDAYSGNSRTDYGVFPTIGNHDVTDPDWTKAQDYVRDRVMGADNLLDSYGKSSYVWRWGPYVFFQLGLWAGGKNNDDEEVWDKEKLAWFREALRKHVGNSGFGVFILQHYGFDGFSKQERWWTDDQRDAELDILCRRADESDPCLPYNILGILTGHAHAQEIRHAHPGARYDGSDVSLRNFVFYAAGDVGDKGEYGFSVVTTAPGSGPNTVDLNVKSKEEKSGDWSTASYHYPLMAADEPDNFMFSNLPHIQDNGENLHTVMDGDAHPLTGDVEFGAGMAVGHINDGGSGITGEDVVFVGIDSRPGGKRFYYRIGFDKLTSTSIPTFDHWGSILYSPSIGTLTAGAGAALADIDGNGKPDLVLTYVDAPSGADHPRYLIGWDLDAAGKAARWSDLMQAPSTGNQSQGGGAAMADINGNGKLDLLLMVIDAPDGPNAFRYVIGWDLDAQGKPSSWSSVKEGPAPGKSNAGGGADLVDVNGNGTLDLVFVALDAPKDSNYTWRRVHGWDLNAQGVPASWSQVIADASGGGEGGDLEAARGAAIAFHEHGENLLVMAVAGSTTNWSEW